MSKFWEMMSKEDNAGSELEDFLYHLEKRLEEISTIIKSVDPKQAFEVGEYSLDGGAIYLRWESGGRRCYGEHEWCSKVIPLSMLFLSDEEIRWIYMEKRDRALLEAQKLHQAEQEKAKEKDKEKDLKLLAQLKAKYEGKDT